MLKATCLLIKQTILTNVRKLPMSDEAIIIMNGMHNKFPKNELNAITTCLLLITIPGSRVVVSSSSVAILL